jgi:hypothetical protein
MFFIWDDWNIDHIAKHGVEAFEAEEVARSPKRPFPRFMGNGKFLIRGRTAAGRKLQVIYVERAEQDVRLEDLDPIDRLALEQGERAVYVIHARGLRRGERYS